MTTRNPYAPPQTELEANELRPRRVVLSIPAQVEGEILLLPVIGASLPCVCAKCGSRNNVGYAITSFSWQPRWAYLTWAVGPLAVAIATYFSWKVAAAMLPMCGACTDRLHEANRIRGYSFVAPLILASIVGCVGFLIGASRVVEAVIITLAISVLVLPAAATIFVERRRSLKVTVIDKQYARLRGASPAFLLAVREAAKGDDGVSEPTPQAGHERGATASQ